MRLDPIDRINRSREQMQLCRMSARQDDPRGGIQSSEDRLRLRSKQTTISSHECDHCLPFAVMRSATNWASVSSIESWKRRRAFVQNTRHNAKNSVIAILDECKNAQ